MDIKSEIEKIVETITKDKGFAEKFSSDPIKTVKEFVGDKVPEEQIKKIADGIKAKISFDKADDIVDSIKKLF